MKFSLFAVIDGHGGDWCAHYIRKRLADELRKQLDDPVLGVRVTKSMNECIASAFSRTFKAIDEGYFEELKEVSHKCGAAMCLTLIVGNRVYTANVGDSRAVLCRNSQAFNLSNDHKTVSAWK
jgi:protein phosphatase 1L